VSKAYSNKALPAGTIIREWRLEDVLGVGGFGIVYKGRGIYFGELVAIKEYFPSAISERDAEDTVVPIGSDVEEVHALGLKKFVEEAKLLWNLSTPSRHPNIVSVRALFEIHGTAYMVMDFEDGMSLSRLLKDGRRFNERSLWNIIKPIAEGLDRAHRVGVLHRDIKPPNILINEDNRPVLIDFGSARFEAAEATSTSVTFHTPPYAAVEQYVKTYDQGPWTDIYALSVVMYECVTGEKPPEVLERLHGGMGTTLAEGHWPGFSKKFLQAIDAGMTIRPNERPQSIREWLLMFGKKDEVDAGGGDDEATRFFAHEVASEGIVPVATPVPGFDQKDTLETGVPTDPREAQFKRAGQETKTSKKKKVAAVDAAEIAKAVEEQPTSAPEDRKAAALSEATKPAADIRKPAAKVPADAPDQAAPWYKQPRVAALGGGVGVLAAIAAGFLLFGKGNSDSSGYDAIPALTEAGPIPLAMTDIVAIAADERALAGEAKTAGAPVAAVDGLVAAGEQLDKQLVELRSLLDDPAQAAAATARTEEIKRAATAANTEFANALLRDAEARAQRLPLAASASGAGKSLSSALGELRTAVQASASATDPVRSLAAARDALAKSQVFAAALPAAAASAQIAARKVDDRMTPAASPTLPRQATTATTTTPTAAAAVPVAASPSAAPSSSKISQIRSVISSGRNRAKQVIAMGSGSGTRAANAKLAKNYEKYFANLSDSLRGARTDRELDQLLKQANQTKAYVDFLYKQSSQSN
jgi:non-specific serine/threonine protein kinase